MLDKWLVALWMISNCKNGVSSYEIGRAWSYPKVGLVHVHRIRLGLQDKRAGGKIGGGPNSHYRDRQNLIGGRAGSIHKSRRQRMTTVGKYTAKTAVMGILERGGKVRANVMDRETLRRCERLSARTSPRKHRL